MRFPLKLIAITLFLGFPGGSEVKVSASNAGDLGSIPGSGRSPGEGNGNPLQYSCLENPMDRKAWQAKVHGVAKSQTQLSNFTFRQSFYYQRDFFSSLPEMKVLNIKEKQEFGEACFNIYKFIICFLLAVYLWGFSSMLVLFLTL